jgi:putative DNA primase/helicase
MRRHAKRSQSRGGVEAMIALVRSEPGVLGSLSDFDLNPWLFNVANGTIDLRTGALTSHRREDHITKLVPITFDSKANCPLWQTFVRRVTCNDDALYDYLQRFIGYSLTGIVTEQSVHFLFGQGANGKSVFCEVLAELMGNTP